ncbi:hypothetical protein ABZV67_39995 [Streptomyces sp. NPDC005065]|uniref:hypothetical protein n=1 Tax=Streptomyces sp. NPDC005065 TaxID=3154461 RepID=UPI0033BA3D37
MDTWVTAILQGKPKQACLVMAEPASGSTPAQVGTPQRCNSDDPQVREMQDNISKFRESFTPKGSNGAAEVKVAETQSTDDKALIPADKIYVGGQPLDAVILSNSTGLEKEQLDVKVESTKIDSSWWVTNIEFNVG